MNQSELQDRIKEVLSEKQEGRQMILLLLNATGAVMSTSKLTPLPSSVLRMGQSPVAELACVNDGLDLIVDKY
jgi:hypothetical protein